MVNMENVHVAFDYSQDVWHINVPGIHFSVYHTVFSTLHLARCLLCRLSCWL